MVLIPAGIFRMGCDLDKSAERCQDDELPLHSVSLDAFSIDRSEVTNAQYAACVSAGACQPPVSPASTTRPDYFTNPVYTSYPVVYVTWFDANAYCLWAGKRLPSEAEWEKAARLGKLAQRFPWGDGAPNCDRANYRTAEGACIGDTNAIGSYPDGVNSAGLFDFSGNASEWVFDWYKDTTYISSIASNPLGPRFGDSRVVRGGSWNSLWEDIRLARRGSLSPTAASPEIGFRCARWP
jgi:formylglycine-generating enzyme required for sulfatase activity